MVEGLVLMNVNPCAEGWMDWAASKVRLGRARQAGGVPASLQGSAFLVPLVPFLNPQESNLPWPCLASNHWLLLRRSK